MSPDTIYEGSKSKNHVPGLKHIYILIFVIAIFSPIGLLAKGSAWGEWDVRGIKSLIGYIYEGMKNGFSYQPIFANLFFQRAPADKS